MKRVRECDGCGYYNRLTRTECSNCGKRIDNVPIKSVDDNLDRNPDFGKTQENVPNVEIPTVVESAQEKNHQACRCRVCGEVNVFPADKNFVYCSGCERLLNRADAEWVSADELKKTEGAEVTADKKRLCFASVSGKGEFILTFTAERQVFGRRSCDNEFICNNKFISREHFQYLYKDGKACVIDISNNGTFINDKRLTKGEECVINAGDFLKLSNEEFIVKNVD